MTIASAPSTTKPPRVVISTLPTGFRKPYLKVCRMTETSRKLTKIFWMNSPRVSRDHTVWRFPIDRFSDEQWLIEYDGFRTLPRHDVTGVFLPEILTRQTLSINLVLIVLYRINDYNNTLLKDFGRNSMQICNSLCSFVCTFCQPYRWTGWRDKTFWKLIWIH